MRQVFAFLIAGFAFSAHAQLLSPAEADLICRAKALHAAHFLAESKRPFVVNYTIAKYAEISTPITYEYRYPNAGITDPLYTVVAYAYPDDKSCTIGSITNNVAGND